MPSLKNLTWEGYSELPIHKKCLYLSQNSRLFDVLFSQQFNRPLLDELYVLTNKIRLISKTTEGGNWLNHLLSTKKVMLYFIQPSTRTFLSFMTASQVLGMKVSEVRSTEMSSELKGESFEDTIRAFSSYFDVIIMRHPKEGYAEKAAFVLNQTRRPVPVINAGSGKDQHPTQALLDIFTLLRSFERLGGLEGKTIMMAGDLKRGRTVRSLTYLLTNFEKIHIIFSSPETFRLEKDIKDFLKQKKIDFTETTEYESQLAKADAVYMTRIQDEYDLDNESSQFEKSKYVFRREHLRLLKSSSIIMHPLPRRDEIETTVDEDPRVMYWRQVRNGMWVRAALIAYIFGADSKILER